MAEWMRKKLADVVELRRGFDLPTRSRKPGKFPVLSAGVTAGLHDEGPIKGPGFVVGRATNLGVPTWSDGDFWPLNTTLYASDFKGNHPRFLYHLFEVLDLAGFDSGSVQPMLNRNYIAGVEVRIPDLATQVAIVDVLKALDHKMATNEKVASISRELARSIFARATIGGNRVAIRNVAKLVTRGITPKYVETDGIAVLNQKCVRDQRINLAPSRMTHDSSIRAEKLLRRDDVLVNSTGAGTLGRIARWTQKDRATVDSHITIVRFDPDLIEPVCAGFGLLQIEKEVEGLAEGSTGQTELRRDLLAGLEIAVPDKVQQGAVGAELSALDELNVGLQQESDKLAATRDELLPLLMSGKIRVREVEKVVEGVV